MKEAWDAESKLWEIGEITKRSDKGVEANGTLLKIRVCGNKYMGCRKADGEATVQYTAVERQKVGGAPTF